MNSSSSRIKLAFSFVLSSLVLLLPYAVQAWDSWEVSLLALDHLCKDGGGSFPNPYDPSGHTFIRCRLETIEMQCDEDFTYDEHRRMCVPDPVRPPVDPEDHINQAKLDWKKILICPDYDNTYHRNPYNCSLFFRCYTQGTYRRIDPSPISCPAGTIFNEAVSNCLPIKDPHNANEPCDNKRLPNWVLRNPPYIEEHHSSSNNNNNNNNNIPNSPETETRDDANNTKQQEQQPQNSNDDNHHHHIGFLR